MHDTAFMIIQGFDKKVLTTENKCAIMMPESRKEIKKMDKRMFKKTGEELQQYLAFRRKAGRVPAKKGKGSYKRSDFKSGR